MFMCRLWKNFQQDFFVCAMQGNFLDSANRIMHAICKDQPQLFWLDESFQYSYRQGLSGSEKSDGDFRRF